MGKKESKRLQTNPGNLKTIHYAPKRMRAPTFNAVISSHRLTNKMLGLIGAEVNFRGRVWSENKDSLSKYFVSNAQTTGMKKAQ